LVKAGGTPDFPAGFDTALTTPFSNNTFPGMSWGQVAGAANREAEKEAWPQLFSSLLSPLHWGGILGLSSNESCPQLKLREPMPRITINEVHRVGKELGIEKVGISWCDYILELNQHIEKHRDNGIPEHIKEWHESRGKRFKPSYHGYEESSFHDWNESSRLAETTRGMKHTTFWGIDL
jgi:hypothetical protein